MNTRANGSLVPGPTCVSKRSPRRLALCRGGLRSLVTLCGLAALGGVSCSIHAEDRSSESNLGAAQQAVVLSDADKNDLTTAFYDLSNLLTIDIEMSAEVPYDWGTLLGEVPVGGGGMDSLMVTGDRFNWYPAQQVTITGTNSATVVATTEVEVRKKSWWSSWSNTKPSLRIKFTGDMGKEVENLIGTRKLMLNNSLQDPDFIRQCVGYRLFNDAKLPYSRCNFALVRVNGMPVEDGLYVNVEPFEDRYADNNFNFNKSGNLYEFEVGEDFSTDPSVLERTEWKNGFSTISNKEDLRKAGEQIVDFGDIASVVDVPQFIKYWAMEALLGHTDSYTGNRNNVYIYNDVSAVADPNIVPAPGVDDVNFKFAPMGIDSILWGGNWVQFNSVLAQKVALDPALMEMLRRQIYVYLGTVFNAKTIDTVLAPWIRLLANTANSIVPGSVDAAATDNIINVLKQTRSNINNGDPFFGITAPTTTVKIAGWNNECAHRGNASAGTNAWEIDHKACSSGSNDPYRFNLVESSSMPGHFVLSYAQVGAPFTYAVRADNLHTITGGLYDVYYGQLGGDVDYPQYFALIPYGTDTDRRYEIQSVETGLCLHFSGALRTAENNYQVYQAACDGAEKNLVSFVEATSPCSEATAIDLGSPGHNVTVANDGCVMIKNNYPYWWGTSRTMQLQNTNPGSYPVPFTWSSSCKGSSGSGTYTGDWQGKFFGPTSSGCATVIDLQGSGSGTITLRYFG